jgi:hypothetical protein
MNSPMIATLNAGDNTYGAGAAGITILEDVLTTPNGITLNSVGISYDSGSSVTSTTWDDISTRVAALSAIAPNGLNSSLLVVNETIAIQNADTTPTRVINTSAGDAAVVGEHFGIEWVGDTLPFVMETLDATPLQVKDTTFQLNDSVTPLLTTMTASTLTSGASSASWATIIAGGASIGTLDGVLANGNTATGTYATITLTDTDVGGQANPILTLNNTNATGSVGLEVYKNKPTAGSTSDVLFNQSVYGKNSGNAKREYTRISHTIRDATAGAEDGSIEMGAFVNGTFANFLQINGNENEVNCLKILDMGGNNIRTNTGDMTITTTASSGTGTLSINGKGTTSISAPLVGITATGASQPLNLISSGANGYVAINGADDVALTAGTGDILLVAGGLIKTDETIETNTGTGGNGSKVIFAGGTIDQRFNVDKNNITLHWNDATSDQADIVLENDLASLNSAINFNYQTTSGNMGTTIQNIPSTQRITQTDGINNKSYESSPNKVLLIENAGRQAKIENSVNSGENRMDLFLNQGSGITDQAGIANQIDNQLLYLVHTNNANSKALQLLNPLSSVGGLSYSNTIDTNPCNIQSTHTNLQLTAPSTTAGTGDIIFAPSDSVGNIIFTGTNLQSGSSGGSSGQHLIITLNGTQYKIDLRTM